MVPRREFLKRGLGAVAGSALTVGAGAAPSPRSRPNIVVIMADDMGFSDLGCYGSEIHTPNLDRMAAEGLRFTHAYNAARCCPSRAALLTGLHPHQAGMGDMVTSPGRNVPPGPYQGYLNRNCATIAELLRPAGYRTYMSGKWHVGEAPEHWPRRRGFDRYYGIISGGSSYWKLDQEGPRPRVMAIDDDAHVPSGDTFYMTDAFTDNAVRFIEEHEGPNSPFFLYLAYTAPHWPIHAWPEDIEKYRGVYDIGWDKLRVQRHERMIELGIVDKKWPLSPRDPEVPAWDTVTDKEDRALRMAVYAAMIDRMDQGIGRVLDALRKTGADKNTLVLFLSDNGGCHESVEGRNLHTPGTRPGERGSFLAYQRPWANASNTPFRMFKHWTHEGGIATPLIAWAPDLVRGRGTLTHQTAHIADVVPTCLDLARADYPATFGGNPILPLAGRTIVPVLRGKQRDAHSPLYWEHEGSKAIRDGNWKLVSAAGKDWELYDLEADRTELNDLVTKEPKRAKAMLARWNAWADAVGAKR
ncbi:MAG: arylsulfatase [Candidatus Hydrogenedentes bacterium]|nr:arylsulfatase [Candidatus Hydrogenedentota bacterium]